MPHEVGWRSRQEVQGRPDISRNHHLIITVELCCSFLQYGHPEGPIDRCRTVEKLVGACLTTSEQEVVIDGYSYWKAHYIEL